jgi:mRNA-degrading endonuclease YafQ of YafQ-DinJ toxin-antitoxin module
MREIERSSEFKRDFKRIYSNPRHKKNIEGLLLLALDLLVLDEPLPFKLRDHN